MRGANAAENNGSPDKGTIAAASVIYSLMRDSKKLLSTERFEELVTDMWNLDHKGSGDLKDESVKKRLSDILSAVLRPENTPENSSDEKPQK